MAKIVLGLIFLYVFYTLIPYLYSFFPGSKVFRKSEDPTKIAFTFDDGPDPKYTPMLLDLLKQYNIKATFFVVGSKAEKNPKLILRMHKEGHLIGLHNYVHTSNWMMFPWTVRHHLDNSAAIIEKITGCTPVYYRPPWGLLNLSDFFSLTSYKIVLWSVMAEDWKKRGGSEKVKKKLSKIEGGDVILLHDCGTTFGADEEAPMNTIDALKDVLKETAQKGLVSVRIDEMQV